ncbi:MAG: DMT family transporter [Planctomycetota bacterium]
MERRALVLGALACLSWSTVFVLGRLTIREHATDPVVLGLYRFGLGSAFLTLLAASRGCGLRRALRAEPWRFLLLGLTGGFGMAFFVFLALKFTTSVTTQIIMNSNPVLIVPLSLLIGERVGLCKVAGVVLGVVGCVLTLGGMPAEAVRAVPGHVTGGVFAALSGLCWAVYTVAGRGVVRRHGGLTTTTISAIIGGFCFLVVSLALGKDIILGWQGAVTGLYIALVPTAFGFTAWYVALEKLPANVLGPLQFIVPVGGVAMALVVLGEALTAAMAAGGVLALTGVYLSTRQARPPKET